MHWKPANRVKYALIPVNWQLLMDENMKLNNERHAKNKTLQHCSAAQKWTCANGLKQKGSQPFIHSVHVFMQLYYLKSLLCTFSLLLASPECFGSYCSGQFKVANSFSYSIRQNLWSSQIVKIHWLSSRNQYHGIAVVCKLFSVFVFGYCFYAVVIPVCILLINPCFIWCRRINLLVKCYCMPCIPKKGKHSIFYALASVCSVMYSLQTICLSL